MVFEHIVSHSDHLSHNVAERRRCYAHTVTSRIYSKLKRQDKRLKREREEKQRFMQMLDQGPIHHLLLIMKVV